MREVRVVPNLKLRNILFHRRISQRELSAHTGVHESLISTCIRWGKSTPETRRRIADYLGVREVVLFPND